MCKNMNIFVVVDEKCQPNTAIAKFANFMKSQVKPNSVFDFAKIGYFCLILPNWMAIFLGSGYFAVDGNLPS